MFSDSKEELLIQVAKSGAGEENFYAFIIGSNRAKKKLNHSTRRQMRKALERGDAELFALGWYVTKFLKLLNRDH